MRCDIDKSRIEHCQFINSLKQCVRSVSFQWGQNFEAEASLARILFNVICYCHIRVCTQYATKVQKKSGISEEMPHFFTFHLLFEAIDAE
jgi:hypothetical protein